MSEAECIKAAQEALEPIRVATEELTKCLMAYTGPGIHSFEYDAVTAIQDNIEIIDLKLSRLAKRYITKPLTTA